MIQIHEFSTGINVAQTPSGGWQSLGFTGTYMNVTIDRIPDPVAISIRNQEFQIVEGTASNTPAVIGRVVGQGDSAWSVVALVSRGMDDKGRSAGFYRYFLTEGGDKIPDLLAWFKDYESNQGSMPIYNPFDYKKSGQVTESDSKPSKFDYNNPSTTIRDLLNHKSPIIIGFESNYSYQSINYLATLKSQENLRPIAWAANVEQVEQINDFQIIKPASEKAFHNLNNAKRNPANEIIVAPISFDKQALKAAVQGLINNNKVSPSQALIFAQTTGNANITEAYWEKLFEGQGLTNALSQSNPLYSPQMTRLLTLRAIAIPRTLLEYLGWLIKSKNQKLLSVAETFQRDLPRELNNDKLIEAKIGEGFQIFLSYLLDDRISYTDVDSLFFGKKDGLWFNLLPAFIKDIDHDFREMEKYANGETPSFNLLLPEWEAIREDIKYYWQSKCKNRKDKYLRLAQFFQIIVSDSTGNNLKLKESILKISAVFYQISQGEVPERIFRSIESNKNETKIYKEFYINKKLTPLDRAFNAIKLLENGIKDLNQSIVPIFLKWNRIREITIDEFNIAVPAHIEDGLFIPKNDPFLVQNSSFGSYESIDFAIKESIANGDFTISRLDQDFDNDTPSLIARVIEGYSGYWSVIVLVETIKNKTPVNNSASSSWFLSSKNNHETNSLNSTWLLYHYFLARGQDNIPYLLEYLRKHEKDRGYLPRFNYARKAESKSVKIEVKKNSPVSNQKKNLRKSRQIVTDDAYNYEEVNDLAIIIAKNTESPIAWAFNVEFNNILNPDQCLVIKTPTNNNKEEVMNIKTATKLLYSSVLVNILIAGAFFFTMSKIPSSNTASASSKSQNSEESNQPLQKLKTDMDKTIKSLDEIVKYLFLRDKNFKPDAENKKKTIEENVMSVINVDLDGTSVTSIQHLKDLIEKKVSEGSDKESQFKSELERLKEKISTYQKGKNITPIDGVIDLKGDTVNSIKCSVNQKLKLNIPELSPETPICKKNK